MTLTFGKCLVLSTCFAVLHGFFAIFAFSLCNIECLSDTDEAKKHRLKTMLKADIETPQSKTDN